MLDSNKGELSQIWKKTMDLFVEKKDIDSVSFQSFYARSRLYDINQEFATVVVSTQIEKQVLQHELIDIQNILSSVVGYPVVCQLVLQKEIEMIEPAVVTQKRNEILFENKIKEEFNFDNFVVGKNNREAQAAAMAVCHYPGQFYNPLFIYGNSGLGKTHLIHSIANYVKEIRPEDKVLYIYSEDFVTLIIESMKNKTVEEVKQKMKEKQEERNKEEQKMGKVLIVGCGGVASVAVHKCCQNSEVFEEICLASRTKSKCDALKEKLEGTTKTKITTAQVDADNVEELIALIEKEKPDVVLNLALPYQDLTIMDACLATKTHYVDTANYEPEDTAKFEYSWQWAYRERFEKAGITALLGSGFDPGVTSVFSAYALKHEFDEINYIDILDCNGGDHGYPFATNFNPEINIREVSAKGSYWEDGKWVETEPMEIKRVYNFDGVGEKDMYLLHHEEIESLALNIPGIKRIRFFMTFGQSYLTHLKCVENVGMTSIEPIMYEGKEIIPLQFLKAVLPDPSSLGPRTKGKTNIGCIFQGKKDGKEKTYQLYNICDHQECYKEVGSQAVAYTTGVPAMIGAMMIMTGKWNKPGVHNIEEFDPDPFMDALNTWGLPWIESHNPVLVD